MKAVNLLPREAQRSFGTFRGMGAATTALIGALGLALVVVAAAVVLTNAVRTKQGELNTVKQQQAAAAQQVASLKPYADLEQARTALLDRVKSLAGGRYDWPQTLARISRAFPADAKLTELNGDLGTSGAPSISLTGCTPSHNRVAALIDRLRAVDGVAEVSLQSSKVDKESNPGSACPSPEQFAITVGLEAPTGAAAATATGTPGATPAPATSAPAAPATTTPPAPAAPAAPAGGTQ
jgi:Tfp pilus assembly protein PilN